MFDNRHHSLQLEFNCSTMQSTNSPYKILILALLWPATLTCAEEGVVASDNGQKDIEYDAAEVIGKSPFEILDLRGFDSEEHYARTKDGYYIHVVRVINPLIKRKQLKRPVIFNHGLLESSTIWLINSHNVEPLSHPKLCEKLSLNETASNETKFLNGPMLLANNGYDVWLMSMRGTDWSMKHDSISPKDPKFWNYCLDDFALIDVPTVIDYVRKKTGSPKVGYIGHSQATFSVFGLLATQPSYADMIEPVVAVAPVAYFDHITSIGRLLFLGTLRLTNKSTHGPFPRDAKSIRTLLNSFCETESPGFQRLACRYLTLLISGRGKHWLGGYYSHIPFYTSLKVLRHFGQLIKNKRFMMYDYGEAENLRIYGSAESPSYRIENIRSKSICLISTKSDALSPPNDVERFKKQLTVPLHKDIFIDRDFNHFDLITHEDSAKLVFTPVLEIFESFEYKSGICAIDRKHNKHITSSKITHVKKQKKAKNPNSSECSSSRV